MSTETTITMTQSDQGAGRKMLTAMVGIGVMCALLIVLTYEGTRERISTLRAAALQEAIFRVVPGITATETWQRDASGVFVRTENPDVTQPQIFTGYNEAGELVGFAIEASGQGYADVIRILYGYDPFSQKIIGFQVLESKETPGLGDKIEKDPAFLANFEGLDVSLNEAGNDLSHEVVATKAGEKEQPWEIDGITGATISSRAIADIIDKSASEVHPDLHENIEKFTITD